MVTAVSTFQPRCKTVKGRTEHTMTFHSLLSRLWRDDTLSLTFLCNTSTVTVLSITSVDILKLCLWIFLIWSHKFSFIINSPAPSVNHWILGCNFSPTDGANYRRTLSPSVCLPRGGKRLLPAECKISPRGVSNKLIMPMMTGLTQV